jgi:hypothetical protein
MLTTQMVIPQGFSHTNVNSRGGSTNINDDLNRQTWWFQTIEAVAVIKTLKYQGPKYPKWNGPLLR